MHRMLLWKEWREQRLLVLMTLALSAATPLLLMAAMSADHHGADPQAMADVLPAMLLGLLWPFFLLGAGANTIATELGEGTLGFLLSRPVSRARLWSAKVLVAAASAGLVLVWIVVICWMSSWLAGRVSLLEALLPGSGPFADFLVPGMIIGLGVSSLFYATAVFFSTVLSRTLTAAAAALAASLAVIAGLVFLWSRLDLVPRLEPQWLSLQLLLSSAAILGVSFWLFSRGEMLLSRGPRAAACAALALVGLPAAAVPSILALTRLTPAEAILTEMNAPVSGSAVFATAARPDGGSSEIWEIPTDGSDFVRLTGRLAMHPVVSPDGLHLAYLSARGPLGLRSAGASLRIARTDGGRDRMLAGGLRPLVWTEIAFSPDGRHVAVQQADTLVVAAADGSARFTCPLGAAGGSRTWMMGFMPEGPEVLVLRAAREEGGAAKVLSIAAGSCAERVIHDLGAPADLVGLFQPPLSGRYLSLVTQTGSPGSRSRQLHLIDLDSGAHRLVTASACLAPAAFSRDEKVMVYAECLEAGTAHRSVIHRVDLASGIRTRLGEIQGRAWSLLASPSGRRVAARVRRSEHPFPEVILEESGEVRELDEGWTVLGWNGDNRLALAERSSGEFAPRKLALAAAGSWEPRQFHPPAAATR